MSLPPGGPVRRSPSPIRVSVASAFLLAAVSAGAGEDPSAPAQIRPWERAAVELALAHLSGETASWADRLASGSSLALLSRDEAVAEVRARLGEPDGASWTLQSPVGRLPDHTVAFWIETATGAEDLVHLRFAEEEGEWRLLDLRCLAEPSLLLAGLSFSRSGVASAGAGVAGLGVLVLLARFRALRWTGLGVLALFACGGPRGGAAGDDPSGGAASGPIRLAGLQLPDAGGGGSAEKDSARRNVVAQWTARRALLLGDLKSAEVALVGVSEDPAAAPLAALLRARLAVARGRGDEAQERWASLLVQGADADALRLEAAESLVGLGRDVEAASTLRWAASGSTRSAEIRYQLARLVLVEEGSDEEAERVFRSAWQLEPIPRARLFADPLLATIAGRGGVVPLFAVSSPSEPVIEPSSVADPLELPPDARCWARGDHLEIALPGGARLELPGGAVLRPATVVLEDAVAARDRVEDEVLDTLELLRPVDATIGQARLRGRWLTASSALERRQRFDELIALTDGVGAVADQAPAGILRARARALLREDRGREAEDLLVGLGRANIEQGRRDPVTFYDLGEMVAAAGDVELAVRLMERAHAIAPWLGIERRARQLRLDLDLVEDYAQRRTDGFLLRYPRSTEPKYVEALPRVLTAERERISRWIPGTREEIEVHLFPLKRFLQAYSSNVVVLGLFDGRVRVPFADLPSLHPELVAVLSHELAHAMIAEATNDQAPRWFHEGLAEHVQMAQDGLNPYPDLVAADRVLAFPLVESVLEGFGGSALVGLAYEEAGWILHFVETRWGVKGIHRLLDAFADGLDTEGALRQALGRDVAAFEAELRSWAVDEAPARWPTEVVRYDRDWNPYFEKDRMAAAEPASSAAPRVGRREPRPPAGPAAGAGLADRMAAWHAGYSVAVRPVKELLGPVVRTYRQGEARDGAKQACDALARAVPELLAHPTALAPPDARARQPLRRAFEELAALTRSCRLGQDAAVRTRLDAFESELGRAAAVLGAHGLQP